MNAVLISTLLLSAAPLGADNKETLALVEKAITAHGGAEKLDKYLANSTKMKGTVQVMGQAVDFVGTWHIQLPDQMRYEMNIEFGAMKISQTQVLAKDKGWISQNGMTTEMSKEMLEEGREEMHNGQITSQLTPLLKKDYTLSPLGESKVDGKEVVGVHASRKGYRDINLYFDKKTHLLVKGESRVKDLLGGGQEVTQEIFYSDYKPVEGMQVPHKMTMKRDGKDFFTAEITTTQLAETLGKELFEKP